MSIVDIGGDQLYYELHGEGEPLFLVPGLSGMSNYWRPQIKALSREFMVVLHDHRGAGRSTKSAIRYSVDQMTSDVLLLMDHLEIDRAHLVGHSMGGAIGQTLAIQRPDRLRSLVAVASWTKADLLMKLSFRVRTTLLDTAGLAAYYESMPLFVYPVEYLRTETARLAKQQEERLEKSPPIEIIRSRVQAVLEFDRTSDLPEIDIPTLVVGVRDDIVTPVYLSEELANLIPGARLKIMENGGHFCTETQPDEFNNIILPFLRENKGGGSGE